ADVDFLLDAGRGEVHRARRRGGVLSEDPGPLPAPRAREAGRAEGVPAVDLGAARGSLAAAAGRLAQRNPPGSRPDGLAYGRKSAAEEKLEGRRP
ncbi:MAG TPA: hypothetical protein PK598_12370, partial [Thermoanaerobaculia bacterium]|nr:hypothetical protein [Thermoanaerobaculia bacterium]